MQTTSISFFRFDTAATKLWAFGQMQFARGPLNRTAGVSFCKLMGSGTGESFDPRPNFGVYAVLLVWPTREAAASGIASNPVLARYRGKSAENFTVTLQAQNAWGMWDGAQPFEVDKGLDSGARPIGVLTRATLNKGVLLDFWRSVPDVSNELKCHSGLMFKLGMGEVPWVQQVTFSIWRGAGDMRTFAYKSGAHSDAIRLARQGNWFKEDLFARFHIIGAEGTWEGRSPLMEVAAD